MCSLANCTPPENTVCFFHALEKANPPWTKQIRRLESKNINGVCGQRRGSKMFRQHFRHCSYKLSKLLSFPTLLNRKLVSNIVFFSSSELTEVKPSVKRKRKENMFNKCETKRNETKRTDHLCEPNRTVASHKTNRQTSSSLKTKRNEPTTSWSQSKASYHYDLHQKVNIPQNIGLIWDEVSNSTSHRHKGYETFS